MIETKNLFGINLHSFIASTLLFSFSCVYAQAQVERPSPNPPMGGLAEPGSVFINPTVQARREILQGSVDRQYTPQEIEEYRRIIEGYDKAQSGVYSEAAKVIRRRISVGMLPSSPVEEIRLNAENVGSIVFTDALGNPWPVTDVIAPGYLTAQKIKNMIVFRPSGQGLGSDSAVERYGRGSLAVMLEGLDATVPFALSWGFSKEVDGQIEAQIMARNPNSVQSMVRADAFASDVIAENFLDGQIPDGATELVTSHKNARSWLLNGNLYLLTPMAVHSPAYQVGASSAGGMSVYRFNTPPSVINVIVDGSIISVAIGESNG